MGSTPILARWRGYPYSGLSTILVEGTPILGDPLSWPEGTWMGPGVPTPFPPPAIEPATGLGQTVSTLIEKITSSFICLVCLLDELYRPNALEAIKLDLIFMNNLELADVFLLKIFNFLNHMQLNTNKVRIYLFQ